MRHLLNDEHKAIYDRHYDVALKGGCDIPQAHGIAKELTLRDATKASAAIIAIRDRMSNIARLPRR